MRGVVSDKCTSRDVVSPLGISYPQRGSASKVSRGPDVKASKYRQMMTVGPRSHQTWAPLSSRNMLPQASTPGSHTCFQSPGHLWEGERSGRTRPGHLVDAKYRHRTGAPGDSKLGRRAQGPFTEPQTVRWRGSWKWIQPKPIIFQKRKLAENDSGSGTK